MDLRLFRSTENPHHNYRHFDRLNSWTRRLPCRFLEWIGWYTGSIPLRLLGHYRLYQLYKKTWRGTPGDVQPIPGYILQYRASHWIRYYFHLLISRLPSWWGDHITSVEMYALNKTLIYERASVLYEFLANADTDFEKAFRHALDQIQAPGFLNIASITNHQTTINETIIQEPAKEITGKEKGVFSKRQVLIFFDLLAQSAKTEHPNLTLLKKHEAIATFFHALTGKTKDTWLEILKDYSNKDLYAYRTEGERSNLSSTLTNLADITHDAGFRSVATLAEKKARSLRSTG